MEYILQIMCTNIYYHVISISDFKSLCAMCSRKKTFYHFLTLIFANCTEIQSC